MADENPVGPGDSTAVAADPGYAKFLAAHDAQTHGAAAPAAPDTTDTAAAQDPGYAKFLAAHDAQTAANGGAAGQSDAGGVGAFGAPTSAAQAHVQNLGHGVLSLPASIAGIPRAIRTVGQLAGMNVMPDVIANAGDAVQKPLQAAADDLAPTTTAEQMGMTGHPKIAGAVRWLEDTAGNALAGSAAGGALGKVLSMFGVGTTPGDALMAGLKRAGVTPADAAAQATVPGGMIGDKAPGLLRTVAGYGQEKTVSDALAQRAAQSAQYLTGGLEDAVGVPRGSFAFQARALAAAKKANAAPLWQAAMSEPPLDDPVALSYLERPGFTQGITHAKAMALDAGQPMPAFPGAVKPPPTPTMDAVRTFYGRDLAPQEWQAVAQGNPAIAKELAAAQKATPSIPMESVQALKRGVRQFIQQGENGTSLTGTDRARVVNGALREFVDRVKQLRPAYQAANDAYAGDAAMEDALQLGHDHFAGTNAATADDVRQALQDMTPGEADVYRSAAIDAHMGRLEALAGSATGDANLLKRGFSSAQDLDKLQSLVGHTGDYSKLQDVLQRIGEQNFTRKMAMGGSSTVPQAIQAAQFQSALKPSSVGNMIRLATPSGLGNLADRVAGGIASQTAQRNAATLAHQLTAQGPDILAILKAAQSSSGPLPAAALGGASPIGRMGAGGAP